MKNYFTNKKASNFILQILLFSIMLLMVGISCNKIEKLPNEACGCDTVELGIDTTYKHTPTTMYQMNGDLILSESLWTWTKKYDTIQVGGYYDNGGEGGGSIHMFFKKNDKGCIDYLFTRYIEYEDNLQIDENGNYIAPWYYMDVVYNGTVTLQVQEYIEDSLFVGQVGGEKFWMEFCPEYEHPDPWRYEVIPNP